MSDCCLMPSEKIITHSLTPKLIEGFCNSVQVMQSSKLLTQNIMKWPFLNPFVRSGFWFLQQQKNRHKPNYDIILLWEIHAKIFETAVLVNTRASFKNMALLFQGKKGERKRKQAFNFNITLSKLDCWPLTISWCFPFVTLLNKIIRDIGKLKIWLSNNFFCEGNTFCFIY
jgi:hypothetical protein